MSSKNQFAANIGNRGLFRWDWDVLSACPFEAEVLEISESGRFVKIQPQGSASSWVRVGDLKIIEWL